MAKFRKNHSGSNSRRGSASSKTTLIRSVAFFIGVVVIIYFLTKINSDSWTDWGSTNVALDQIEFSETEGSPIEKTFLPESTTGMVIHHQYYTLSYSEEHEQAEWVAYKLTRENLKKKRVKRERRYNQDDAIHTLSAKHSDYTRSGFTRGHLAPAGDMAFSPIAMRESFLMSNMSPQEKAFNGGIWRELEENVRDWAFTNEELYVVTGPVLKKDKIQTRIGYNEVAVPEWFYKIILDAKEPEIKSIAFLMPNKKSTQPIENYIVSIDEVETLTEINFFADFLPPELEVELESVKGNPDQWGFDENKYKSRLEKWNNF